MDLRTPQAYFVTSAKNVVPVTRSRRRASHTTSGRPDATIKYPRFRVHNGRIFTKWGAIKLDESRFRWVREDASIGRHAQLCFEAQVMDWCNGVTFAVHDTVDFYRGGHTPLERLFTLGATSAKQAGGPRRLPEEAEDFLR
jgi:hypothetical protein